MLIAITYHYVRQDYLRCSKGINGITVAQFEAQLGLLAGRGTFVSAGDVLAAVEGRSPLPARSLLVSFDDGLREQFEQALPILNRMGIPAIFFVNTRPIAEERICTVHKLHLMRAMSASKKLHSALEEGARLLGLYLPHRVDPTKAALQYPYDSAAVARLKYWINFALPLAERTSLVAATFDNLFPGRERALARELYMSRSQVCNLTDAGYLGSHGHDHLPIGQLEPKHARAMLSRSMDHLQRWTGARPYALSYPYGLKDSCSPQTARMAAEFGIRLGFTVESAANDAVSLRNPQFLGRFDCNLLPGGSRPKLSTETMFEQGPCARWHQPPTVNEEQLAACDVVNG